MSDLTYTLVTDGTSDRVLRYPIEWLLREWSDCTVAGQWADPTIRQLAGGSLRERIRAALADYPCELLFVHRDAEARPPGERVREIGRALEDLGFPTAVCVIPVRMTEAWFLFEESLIRRAAGNPRGATPLAMPPQDTEALPNPKAVLHDLLRQASGARGRRAKAFNPKSAVHRLAELIDDFSPLRRLGAFQAFEAELRAVLQANGWFRAEH